MSEAEKVNGDAHAAPDYIPEEKAGAENLGRYKSLESKQRALANLKAPFEVGHISKGGRRKKDSILLAEVRKQLRQKFKGDPQGRTAAALIVRSMVAQAIRGNTWAARLLIEASGGFPNPELDAPLTNFALIINRNVPPNFDDPERDPGRII